MKSFIVLSLLIAISYQQLALFNSCKLGYCSSEYTTCLADQGCNETEKVCQMKCGQNVRCLQSCYFSSNSMLAQKLAQCAHTNKCFSLNFCSPKSSNSSCPKTCLNDIKEGNNVCKQQQGGIASDDCIISYLSQKGRTECADKKCVCDSTLTLDIYIAGCFC